MRKILLATLQTLLFVSVVSSQEEFQYDNGVLVATSDNINEITKQLNGTYLLELYAPWCGHCKKLQPHYNAAAKILSQQNPPFQLVKGNAADDKQLGGRFGVRSYPTLIFLKDNVMYKFNGQRTEEGIINWINERIHPVAEIVSCTQLPEKIKNKKVNLVLFADENADQREILVKVAQDQDIYDKYGFFQVTEAECAAQNQVSGSPAFAVFRNFDEPVVEFTGEVNKKDLISFLALNAIPSLFNVTSNDHSKIVLQQGQKVAILFAEANNDETALYRSFRDASQKFRGKMLFAISGMQDGAQDKVRGHFGLQNTQYQTVGLIDTNPQVKHLYSATPVEDITQDELDLFLNNFLEGKLEKYTKSEDVPSEDAHDSVFRKVVSSTWKEEVLDSDDNVVVLYITRKCQSCGQAEHMLRNIADAVREQNSNVKFVLFNDYYNEHEGRDFKGNPEMKIYSNDKNKPKLYNGKSEEAKIKKWIIDNTKQAVPKKEKVVAAEKVIAAEETTKEQVITISEEKQKEEL